MVSKKNSVTSLRIIFFKILTLGTTPILFLLLIEIIIRIWQPNPLNNHSWIDDLLIRSGYGISHAQTSQSSFNTLVAAPEVTNAGFHQYTNSKKSNDHSPLDFSLKYPPGKKIFSSNFLLMPNQDFISIAKRGDKIIYQARTRIDSVGRRLVQQSHTKLRKEFLIFLGCSYIFGEGLDDEDTLPWKMAQKITTRAIYNYGVPAGSPAIAWKISKYRKLPTEIKEESGSALYFLWDFHLARLVTRSNWLRVHPFLIYKPWLSPNSSNDDLIDHHLSLKESKQFKLHIWWGQISLFNWLGIDWFPWYRDSDFDFLISALRGIEKNLRKQLSLNKFLVVLPPPFEGESPLISEISHRLNQAQISTLDFSQWKLNQIMTQRPEIEDEGHPSAAFNNFFSDYLAKEVIKAGI